MEFKIGQEISVGVDTTGIIWDLDEERIYILNWDRNQKIHTRKFIEGMKKINYVEVKEEPEDEHMQKIRDEAIDMRMLKMLYNEK